MALNFAPTLSFGGGRLACDTLCDACTIPAGADSVPWGRRPLSYASVFRLTAALYLLSGLAKRLTTVLGECNEGAEPIDGL